ncbi:MAG: D-alanine--D-alanine ligase [Candidatus Gastranaerophilales bacterium]|nr:D-alanine--D-alanine ligase [Candidatus Gastranaerophilales bacterium]
MKVVVLAGGISTERDVSLSTGSMIYKALRKNGHQAILLDVYLGYMGELENIFEREEDWAAQIGEVSEHNPDIEAVKALRADGANLFFGPNVLEICKQSDAVFLALHGENGENGKIQACFDLMGIAYTGADYVGSAIAMDKGIAKDLFKAWDIPTPFGIRLKKGQEEKEKIPYPCVVKACCGGSSVGVYMASDDREYEAAKEEAFRYGEEVLVEQYIEGREFSVGVIDGKAMPVIEIAPKVGFYDYKNKYQAGSAVETCPAQISEERTAKLQQTAERVFQALRLKNYARMDFRMNEKGEIFCLEANTLPGMTATSLIPQEAAAMGIGFEELCERILRQAK